MSSNYGNVFKAWIEGVIVEPPSSSDGLDPTFSTPDCASHSHLHDINGSSREGVANPSLNVLELPPSSYDDIPKEHSVIVDLSDFSCFESTTVGKPVPSKNKVVENREGRRKRTRSPNWKPEEKQAYLELKEEALQVVVGKPDWDYISRHLWDRHNFDRESKVCEYLWDTLLKAYRAIGVHQASRNVSQTSNWVSYWAMDEDARSKLKIKDLPKKTFPLEWCEMIARILAAQEQRHRSTDRADTSKGESFGKEGSGATIEENDQLLMQLAPFIKQQVEDKVNSALEDLPCRQTSSATTEQVKILTSMAPLVKLQVEDAVIYAFRLLSLSGFMVDVDDPIARFGSDIMKYIKDALNSALHPVASALQALAQKAEKDQARLLAIQEERRALDLEEMKIKGISKRQRNGRHQRTRKSSCKQHGPRWKNSSTWGDVVPALKELCIAREVDLLEDE